MAEVVKNKSGMLGKILKALLNIVIFLVVIIAVVLVLYVFSAQVHKNDRNYKPFLSFYTIVSPSMNPVIKVYDVVVNARVATQEDIEVGDVITYISTNATSEGMTITHRVVNISKADNGAYEYQTQGDNNSEPDGVLVTFDNVIGKKIFVIPQLGRIQFLLANKKGWFVLLLIPILLFVFKDVTDLIELFGLRKKVDNVTGSVEGPLPFLDNQKDNRHKEILKRELSIHQVKADALIKRDIEGEGFLEPYSEIIVDVGKPVLVNENADVEPMKIIKADIIEGDQLVPNTDDEEINERIREAQPILSPVEILDSDELTKKIKDYDNKVAELNDILIKLEKMTKLREQESQEENSVVITNSDLERVKEKKVNKDPKKIVDNYLIGRKIRVVNSVEAQKRKNKKPKETAEKMLLGKEKDGVNARLVIEKPQSMDLPKKKEITLEQINNDTSPSAIEVKPEEIVKKKKKMTTLDVILRDLNTINKKEDNDLLFNPKMIKRVDSNKKEDKKSKKEKKGRFIYIVKEKDKRN